MKIDRKHYFRLHCRNWIIEDNMVSYNVRTNKGFCRQCSSKLTCPEMLEIEEVGFYQGEQLSFA